MHRYLSYIGYLLCIFSLYGFANLAALWFPMVVQFSLGLIIWGLGQILLELKKITAALPRKYKAAETGKTMPYSADDLQ